MDKVRQKDMFFETKDLAVGYNGKVLIDNININIKKGQITTLIGPNGSGKSTILKTITKHLEKISGVVYINKKDIKALSDKDVAKSLSVVLTERISTEYMTCEDIVGLGRYPYTNNFGTLTQSDKEIIEECLAQVEATDLKDRDFSTLSDGQKQRILLARALCQQPEIIVLDEPTSFLDVHHKIKLLNILRKMAKGKNISVIMSLHEIDLAPKISDMIMCVKGSRIKYYGTPENVFKDKIIEELYALESDRYNLLFGSIELPKVIGIPEIFIVAGNGCGIPYYRELQKRGLPFRTGILYENDIDYQVAKSLSSDVYVSKPFQPMDKLTYEIAYTGLKSSKYVIDAGTEIGEYNKFNKQLIDEARNLNIMVFSSLQDFFNKEN
ncbi:MAG TPA: iron ABC transporter ATP-binding protein [Clostridium sp.]|nr:iron ABC transporter ATP-binding protein [Clostridium sp.]